MVIYSLMFILCVFFSFFAERKRRAVVIDTGETVIRPGWFLTVLSAVPVIFFAGMRGGRIADTGAYINMFESLTWDSVKDALQNISDHKDVGFTLFTHLVKLVVDDYTFWLFVIAIFSVACLWRTFYKYSDTITFSIFLFFGTTTFSWLFNGMRQYIAVAGMFAMFPLLLKTGDVKKDRRNCILFVVGTLILATIHMTALVILPVYFLCRGEILNRVQMTFILAFVGASSFVTPFTSFLGDVFSETQYSNITSEIETYEGANILRLFIVIVPVILGLYRINQIREMKDPVLNFAYNMSMLNVCLMIPAVTISGNVFSRFAEYCNTFTLILYPMVVGRCYTGKTKRLLYLTIILAYVFWFYYQMELTWNWPYMSEYLGTFR